MGAGEGGQRWFNVLVEMQIEASRTTAWAAIRPSQTAWAPA
jgi:hypothetical protein